MPGVKRYICTMPEAAQKRMANTPSRKRTRPGFLTGSLMGLAILAVTGFQAYWLKNNYQREKENLDITTKASFKETIEKLQSSKMRLESFTFKLDTIKITPDRKISVRKPLLKNPSEFTTIKVNPPGKEGQSIIGLMGLLQQRLRDSMFVNDSLRKSGIITIDHDGGETIILDSTLSKKGPPMFIPMLDSLTGGHEKTRIRMGGTVKNGSVISLVYKDGKTMKDSLKALPENVIVRKIPDIEIKRTNPSDTARRPMRVTDEISSFLYQIDSLFEKDSVTVKEITTAYKARLRQDNIDVPFSVIRLDSTQSKSPDAVTIGFTNSLSFELALGNTLGYMFSKLKLAILFSVLLVGITIAAFFFLYRNMMKQKRLAEMKNDLISNISHELKTPIATVGVALEALKSFNAMHNPERTKEYIDISQGELQRLNLLVDKVLKLSIFEKKDIELKKERFDYKLLTAEIMNSMKLQFEKYHAKVSMHTVGDSYYIDADKLHITSVVYNLLDNALKYSTENPVINVRLESGEDSIKLSVEDNGIGIPPEYKSKVFEKFFRVPTGDRHNIKGYGLGLSYVAEVVKRHNGEISVDSDAGKGSTFTVTLPIAETPVIPLDTSADNSKKKTS